MLLDLFYFSHLILLIEYISMQKRDVFMEFLQDA